MRKPKKRYGQMMYGAWELSDPVGRHKEQVRKGLADKETAFHRCFRQWLRLRCWLAAPLKCKLGRHVFDWNEIDMDYSLDAGISTVGFHCLRCQKRLGEMFYEDLPEYVRNYALDLVNSVKEDLE